MSWTLHKGDVRRELAKLEPQSQQVCVTSPPYHGLRAYGTTPQIWEASCCDHPHDWGEEMRLDRKHIWKEGAAGYQERTREAGGHERTNGQLCQHVHDWGEPVLKGGGSQQQGTTSARVGRANVEAQIQRGVSLGQVCAASHEHEWTEARPAGYRGSDTNPGALQHEGNKGRERLTSSVCLPCGSWRGELGLEPQSDCMAWTRGEPPCAMCYVCHMRTIFGGAQRNEGVWRALRDDGTLWLNLGDGYNSFNANRGPSESLSARADDGRNDAPRGLTNPKLKPKDLLGIPWRVAFALQADGWYWRSVLAWCKKSAMPESVSDRPTNAWEPIFLMTKSGDALFWTHRDGHFAGSRTQPRPDYVWQDRANADAEQCEEPEGWRTELLPGSKVRKRWRRLNLWSSHDYFYDKEAVSDARAVVPSARSNGHSDDEDAGRNMRNYVVAPEGIVLNPWWLLGPEPNTEEHYATWPTEIARRAIKAGSSEKGACRACGAPWARVTKQARPPDFGRGSQSWTRGSEMLGNPQRDNHGGLHPVAPQTIGWAPTCSCRQDGGPVPCNILDPFAGSGTTLLVADRLGRHGVGIELLDKYVEIAERRLASDAPLLDMFADAEDDGEADDAGESLVQIGLFG